jgi:molybdenum cofactor biosynthesis enzyme MoaA
MIDQFGRAIRYVHISVTDRCNLDAHAACPTVTWQRDPGGHPELRRSDDREALVGLA